MQKFKTTRNAFPATCTSIVCGAASKISVKPIGPAWFAFCISIVCGALSKVSAAEFGDAFVQIQDSTTKDPAGAQLMVISIGILVTMVLAIFTVTMIYISKGSKKSRPKTETPE